MSDEYLRTSEPNPRAGIRDRLIEVVAKALIRANFVWENLAPWEKEDARLDAAAIVDALGVEHYTDVTNVDPVNGGLPLYRLRCLEDDA